MLLINLIQRRFKVKIENKNNHYSFFNNLKNLSRNLKNCYTLMSHHYNHLSFNNPNEFYIHFEIEIHC